MIDIVRWNVVQVFRGKQQTGKNVTRGEIAAIPLTTDDQFTWLCNQIAIDPRCGRTEIVSIVRMALVKEAVITFDIVFAVASTTRNKRVYKKQGQIA